MRVLFYYLYGQGGGFSNLKNLLRAMAVRYPGDSFTIVCHPSCDMVDLEQISNVTVSHTGGRVNREVTRLQMGLHGLSSLARSGEYDIIWAVNVGSYRRLVVPQVMTMNNSYQVHPFSDVKRLHPKGPLFVFMLRRFFSMSLRHSNAVITQSPFVKRQLLKTWRFQGRVEVISKSVGNDRVCHEAGGRLATRLQEAERGKWFSFLYVATHIPHKNHKVLLRALVELAHRQKPIRLVLTLTEDEVREIGGDSVLPLIADGVIVPLGWVSRLELRALYDACDACVMPSILECVSSAHLESMAWSKPQISSDLPYAADLCGDASLYAHPNSVEDWVAAMIRLSEDQDLRRNLVSEGLRIAERLPESWKRVAELTHRVLEQSL